MIERLIERPMRTLLAASLRSGSSTTTIGVACGIDDNLD